MSKTDCRNVRREIEDMATGELLSAPARAHLSDCSMCATFGNEHDKLKEMVASLGTIEAPADFDFRLRARLATSRASRRNLWSGGGFGIRSVAFASLILLLGFIVVLVNLRSRNNELARVGETNQPASVTSSEVPAQVNKNNQDEQLPKAHTQVAVAPAVDDSPSVDVQSSSRNVSKRSVRSILQYATARNGRVKATDLSATAAPLLRPTETALGSSVFPLGTSYQSLKVSVDDGRGSPRTISLPRVSFGSSRVLARDPAPLVASMRDSW
ncbi:MAG: hypothetical protein ACR2H4_07010 [Pyrinomonadaceae bacterium]